MRVRALHCAAWLAAILIAASTPASSQEPSMRKRVLMLYAHDPNAPGTMAFTNQLQAAVQADPFVRVEFYSELLDLGRFPENAHRKDLLDYIVGKYRGFRFDAILPVGARALSFAIDRVRPLFPGVPIVYGLAFEPVIDFSALPAGATGRHHRLPFVPTLELARSLQPDAERVVLIGGMSSNDSLLLGTALQDLAPLARGMELVVWRDGTYASLLKRLHTLPPRTITILTSYTRDQAGQEFNTGDLIPSITRLASAPVYGIARNWVGDGVVGGVTMDFADDGARTGRLLLQVLDSVAAGHPVPPSELAQPARVVDSRALERWGLSERRLPAGTTVLFGTPTVWERFGAAILAIAAVVAAQGVWIALLLLERRRRVRAVQELQERRDQLAHLGRVATLGELTAAISHELRQSLAAIRANAEAGAMLLDRSPSDLREARDAFADIASDDRRAVEVLDNIRRLVRKDDPVAAPVNLNEVCERSAELLMSDAVQRGIHLRLALAPGLPAVIGDPVQLQQVVVNLALNGMDAVQASAGAREVVVGTSTGSDGQVELVVRDTGPGLSSEARLRAFEPFFSTKRQGMGMGLAIVRSIVERHRGRVDVENANGAGASLRVQLPAAHVNGRP
jgi:signal transduction histidine kinase